MSFSIFKPSTYCQLSYIDRIKLLMMVAMTVGHLAWAFVPTETWLSEVLHFFGRLTIPLACFLVVEGYRLTHDVWAYVKRLFGFGVLAQVPFVVSLVPLFGDHGILTNPAYLIFYGNVLFTLGFGLLVLILLDKIRTQASHEFLYFLSMVACALLAMWSDWGMLVIFWVVAIFYGGAWGYLAMTTGLFVMAFLVKDLPVLSYVFALKTHTLMDYGLFLATPTMVWYNKHKKNSPKDYRLPRLMFYWYYVGHLAILGLVLGILEYRAL